MSTTPQPPSPAATPPPPQQPPRTREELLKDLILAAEGNLLFPGPWPARPG